MNVAVVTLTRDRLEYTQHCFKSLAKYAGCEYDHYVFDNGSQDGTREWLTANTRVHNLGTSATNLGIYEPLNQLLDLTEGYDVVVNFDNDCELLTPGTLRTVATIAHMFPGNIIGPRVQGLRQPPLLTSEIELYGYRVGVTTQIGGIFMPIPRGWRYPIREEYLYGDGLVCANALQQGFVVGQLVDYPVNHYETTDGQHARYPAYFERRRSEGIND